MADTLTHPEQLSPEAAWQANLAAWQAASRPDLAERRASGELDLACGTLADILIDVLREQYETQLRWFRFDLDRAPTPDTLAAVAALSGTSLTGETIADMLLLVAAKYDEDDAREFIVDVLDDPRPAHVAEVIASEWSIQQRDYPVAR